MMEQIALMPEAMVIIIGVAGGIPVAVSSLKLESFHLFAVYTVSFLAAVAMAGGLYYSYSPAVVRAGGVTVLGAALFLFAYRGNQRISHLIKQVEDQGAVVVDEC